MLKLLKTMNVNIFKNKLVYKCYVFLHWYTKSYTGISSQNLGKITIILEIVLFDELVSQ